MLDVGGHKFIDLKTGSELCICHSDVVRRSEFMHKTKPLLIGQSDFRALRDAGAYYVDKSLFIQEVVGASAFVDSLL